ncbi:probable L-seryl-tRNA(Sec) kinase [Coccomyxa sp. Obi]|nr:probable L-seryl-tRNA(Sec) kinase [Coccomyxa sp. Obi]
MRLECAQLARQNQAAFIVVYMPCTLEDAAARNAQRAEADQVPQEVLSRMAARLEPPCPSRHAWECGTVTVPADELPSPNDHCDQAWAGIWEAILGAWGPPLPEAGPSKQRGPPTTASATAGHDVDLRSRRMVAAAIGKIGSREGRAAAAGRLNAARRDLLARLHKDEGWREPAHALHAFEQMCIDVACQYM